VSVVARIFEVLCKMIPYALGFRILTRSCLHINYEPWCVYDAQAVLTYVTSIGFLLVITIWLLVAIFCKDNEDIYATAFIVTLLG
jgi:hypothetical protein